MAMESEKTGHGFGLRDLIIPLILSAIVVITNQYNFLLFHTLAELFAITVAILLALVAWNMFPFTRNGFLAYLGIGYLWIGVLDLMHALTYKGLSFFTVTGVNVGTQFWISTRYIEALLLLSAPWFLTRRINRALSMQFYALISLAVFVLIMSGSFPATYIEGKGLTDFKINSEYVIVFILLVAIGYLFSQRERLDRRVLNLMLLSIMLTMCSELAFTFYFNIHDISNIIGHLLKIFSYWLIFLAVIRTTLQEPFRVMSRGATTYDAIPDAIVLLDEQGIIRQANKSAGVLVGKPADSLFGQSSYEIFHAGCNERDSCGAFGKKLTQGFCCERELQVGGRLVWLSFSYSPVGDEAGLHGRIEVIRDVTQRKLAELQYERVNTLKDSIVENLPLVLFVKDAHELKYVEWNKKAEQLTGHSKPEVIGKDDFALWPSEEVAFFQAKDREVLREHKLVDIPQESVSTKQGMRTMHTIKIPIYDESGEPQYLLGISEDITQRLQTEQALRQSQKMDALGKLTGGIAHDFNNMLSVISGFTELLLMYTTGNEKLQGYANEILRAGQRGMKLTNKLLAFTRSRPVDEREVDLNKLLREEQHMLEKALTVRIRLVYELGTGIHPIVVSSDDLEDSVLNIAINAMHAMSGSGEFVISTENVHVDSALARELAVSPGAYVKLVCRDTGVGMDQQTCAQIFDPFFSTKGELGTGLGLSQVYGFMRRSHGGIKVISSPGEGSSFELYFPSSAASAEQAGTEPVAGAGEYSGTESVLVVDDEPAIRALLEDFLSEAGYRVTTAGDGEEALGLLQTAPYALLVTDVIMPKLDGYQLAVKALALYPGIKVQFISGYSESIDNHHVDPALLEQSLQKPFSRDELLARVRQLLDSRP